jgi:hypothetical protein
MVSFLFWLALFCFGGVLNRFSDWFTHDGWVCFSEKILEGLDRPHGHCPE